MPTAPSAEARQGPSPARRASFGPLILAAAIGFAAGDAFRPPEHQAIARVALAGIDGYRAVVSPRLAATGLVSCRFTPTCSAYGREAIARYGSPKGVALTIGRIARCHPWAKGGEDPVP